MSTQSLDGASNLVRSLPVRVRFAGFESDTLTLARAGWDLSMKQGYGFRSGYEMQLVMRHGDKNKAIYCMSHPLNLDYGAPGRAFSDAMYYAKLMSEIGFDIAYAHSDISFRHMVPMSTASFLRDSFMPIDPRPQEVEESIKDFKFFKVAKPTVKDLIVAPEDVPELLNLVMKAQAPMLEKVRARERSRKNFEEHILQPRHSVEAQIITLGA